MCWYVRIIIYLFKHVWISNKIHKKLCSMRTAKKKNIKNKYENQPNVCVWLLCIYFVLHFVCNVLQKINQTKKKCAKSNIQINIIWWVRLNQQKTTRGEHTVSYIYIFGKTNQKISTKTHFNSCPNNTRILIQWLKRNSLGTWT